MKRYGVLCSLIMVGSVAAMDGVDEEGSFLRRSASLDILPLAPLSTVSLVRWRYVLALKKKRKDEEGNKEEVLEGKETHALFEFEEQFSNKKLST